MTPTQRRAALGSLDPAVRVGPTDPHWFAPPVARGPGALEPLRAALTPRGDQNLFLAGPTGIGARSTNLLFAHEARARDHLVVTVDLAELGLYDPSPAECVAAVLMAVRAALRAHGLGRPWPSPAWRVLDATPDTPGLDAHALLGPGERRDDTRTRLAIHRTDFLLAAREDLLTHAAEARAGGRAGVAAIVQFPRALGEVARERAANAEVLTRTLGAGLDDLRLPLPALWSCPPAFTGRGEVAPLARWPAGPEVLGPFLATRTGIAVAEQFEGPAAALDALAQVWGGLPGQALAMVRKMLHATDGAVSTTAVAFALRATGSTLAAALSNEDLATARAVADTGAAADVLTMDTLLAHAVILPGGPGEAPWVMNPALPR